MNKNEAIKAIEQDKIVLGKVVETGSGVNAFQRKIESIYYVPLETVVSMINKINEPQKVTVPQFVADWLKKYRYARWLKKYRYAHTLLKVLDAAEEEQIVPSAVNDWILDNQYDFIKAWIDGYEVEEDE